MSGLDMVDAVRCEVGETLIVAVAADRVYVAAKADDDDPADAVLMLTPDEAHTLGTRLRLAAKKAGR